MGLQAASLLVVFLGCCYANVAHEVLRPNIFAQQDFNQTWIINYTINSTDPNEVLANANAVLQAVKDLKAMVDSLTANLTIANNTDYTRLEDLKKGIEIDAANLTAIRDEYNAALTASGNTQSLLDQINATLQCFSVSSCVTAGPTTPFTGTTPINACTSNPCVNGGTCVQNGNSYTCNCPPPYTGQNCDSVTCQPPSQILSANSSWQDFSATNNPLNDLSCSWPIRGPPGQQVEIIVSNVTFTPNGGKFEIIDNNDNSTLYNTTTSTGAVYNITSSRNVAIVSFDTTQGTSGNFYIRYMAVAYDACVNYTECGNGTCITDNFRPQCQCNSCYTGSKCDIYEGNPCDGFGALCGPNGTCDYDHATCKSPHCVCNGGFTGTFCSPDLPTTASIG